MNCPACGIALTITDRNGIEIDYCQKCRGVWLDRGELDKIIERAAPRGYEDDGEAHEEGRGGAPRRAERENPILDLFDFF